MFAEDQLQARESALQIEQLRLSAPSSSSPYSNDVVTMNDRYRASISRLEGEKTKLHEELEKVICTPSSNTTKSNLKNFLEFSLTPCRNHK